MGLVALATLVALLGSGHHSVNGYHCLGSPGGTGDLLPQASNTYVTDISVIVARPFDEPVGWAYRSNTGHTYVQIGKSGAIMPKDLTTLQLGWHRLSCQLPPRYLTGNAF